MFTRATGEGTPNYVPQARNWDAKRAELSMDDSVVVLCLDPTCLDKCKQGGLRAYGGYLMSDPLWDIQLTEDAGHTVNFRWILMLNYYTPEPDLPEPVTNHLTDQTGSSTLECGWSTKLDSFYSRWRPILTSEPLNAMLHKVLRYAWTPYRRTSPHKALTTWQSSRAELSVPSFDVPDALLAAIGEADVNVIALAGWEDGSMKEWTPKGFPSHGGEVVDPLKGVQVCQDFHPFPWCKPLPVPIP
ncbi:hypothetical protein JCM10449v2_000026 [Rhodotorula kratochvilovae]